MRLKRLCHPHYEDNVSGIHLSFLRYLFAPTYTGFVQDFDMKIQGVFKDYSRTKAKIFKEL